MLKSPVRNLLFALVIGTFLITLASAENTKDADERICTELKNFHALAQEHYLIYPPLLSSWEQVTENSSQFDIALTNSGGVVFARSVEEAFRAGNTPETRRAAFEINLAFEEKLMNVVTQLFTADAGGLGTGYDFARNDDFIRFRLNWLRSKLNRDAVRDELVQTFQNDLAGASRATRRSFEKRLESAIEAITSNREYWSGPQAVKEIRLALGDAPATDANILKKVGRIFVQRMRVQVELEAVSSAATREAGTMTIARTGATVAAGSAKMPFLLSTTLTVAGMLLTPSNSVNYEGDPNAYYAKDLNRFFTNAFNEHINSETAERWCLNALWIIHRSDRSLDKWFYTSEKKIYPRISIADFEHKLHEIYADLRENIPLTPTNLEN